MLHAMFYDKKFIGQKLKEYRKKAKLSQEQIAEKTGLAEKHYGRLERGACMPTLETFFTIIEALNIPLSEFGLNIQDNQTTNTNRDKLLKEVYTSNNAEIELILNIINSIKSYNQHK